jgi:hypothetical protein
MTDGMNAGRAAVNVELNGIRLSVHPSSFRLHPSLRGVRL